MILLISHALSAQTKNDYLTKSKHQKTAAWIMLGGGWGLGITGGIVATHGVTQINTGQPNKVSNNIGNGVLLVLTGGVAMLGSIPLFLSAHKNKRERMSLSFTNQPAATLAKNSTANRFVPSVCLKLRL